MVPTSGVAATIIDFTNSRLTSSQGVQWYDMGSDDSFFTGEGGEFPVRTPAPCRPWHALIDQHYDNQSPGA